MEFLNFGKSFLKTTRVFGGEKGDFDKNAQLPCAQNLMRPKFFLFLSGTGLTEIKTRFVGEFFDKNAQPRPNYRELNVSSVASSGQRIADIKEEDRIQKTEVRIQN